MNLLAITRPSINECTARPTNAISVNECDTTGAEVVAGVPISVYKQMQIIDNNNNHSIIIIIIVIIIIIIITKY